MTTKCPACGAPCFEGSKLCRPCYRARAAVRALDAPECVARIRAAWKASSLGPEWKTPTVFIGEWVYHAYLAGVRDGYSQGMRDANVEESQTADRIVDRTRGG